MSWGPIPEAADRALDVVGVGEVSLDHVIELDHLPAQGGKQPALRERDAPGGQIATAMLACARLGLRTAFAGAIGDDAAGAAALAPLRAAGVDLAGVQVVAGGRTRRALVLVERRRGERSVIEQRDARVALDPAALPSSLLGGTRAVLVDATDPAVSRAAARTARAGGAVVFLDADGLPVGLQDLLEVVDFPVVSQGFAEKTGSGFSVRAGLSRLVDGGARVAVATLGERGALARIGDRLVGSSAFAIEPRDTTGAGDAFHAAWIAAVLHGEELEEALRRANGAAAMNCGADGAQGGLADPEGLASFLSTHRQRGWIDPG
jgi:sugar/nucleoside kinase (ribokinase family)